PQHRRGHRGDALVGRRGQPRRVRPRQQGLRDDQQLRARRDAHVPDVAPRGDVLRRRRVEGLLDDGHGLGVRHVHRDGPGGRGPVGPAGTTVYYATDKGWDAYRVHYRVGTGAWTAVPGIAMAPACEGWVAREIALPDGASGAAATVTAAFTNGSGTWDNNG